MQHLNTSLSNWLDPYDVRARLFPALLAIAPIPIDITCLAGEAKAWTSAASLLLACGATFALSRIARNAGKGLEPGLFTKWGGPPTTQLLRHSDTHIDAITKERYHSVFSKGLGITLPTAKLELEDPEGADELYGAAAKWLLGQTRDSKRFSLVLKENISYGFHRNALGLRPLGLMIAIASIAAVAASCGVINASSPVFAIPRAEQVTPERVVAMLFSLLFFTVWLAVFRESSVKSAAFAYGIRLLESCDALGTRTASQKQTRKPARKKD